MLDDKPDLAQVCVDWTEQTARLAEAALLTKAPGGFCLDLVKPAVAWVH